jgi:hypothetical protein
MSLEARIDAIILSLKQLRIWGEAAKFARTALAEAADRIDRTGEFPRDQIRVMANQGGSVCIFLR